MATFLILGASGALGQSLYTALKQLDPSAQVHGISRSGQRLGCDTGHAINALEADAVLAAIRAIQPIGIFLAAWETKHGYYWNAVENKAWADTSLKVLAHCAAQRIAAVFAGTCAEYAWGARLLSEAATEAPATEYGVQKRRVSDWIARTKIPGIASARLFFPFNAAENENRVTSLVGRAALRGENFHLKAGDVWRDIYPTSVAARAIVALLQARATGIYNLTSGQPEHLGEFLDHLARIAHTGARVTWDRYQPAHGPRYLAGDNRAITPFWPSDWNMDSAARSFLAELRADGH